jgi:hypothetical protein
MAPSNVGFTHPTPAGPNVPVFWHYLCFTRLGQCPPARPAPGPVVSQLRPTQAPQRKHGLPRPCLQAVGGVGFTRSCRTNELGHAANDLTDQISRKGLASIGVTRNPPTVNDPFDGNILMYDVYGATGRDAAIQLGIVDHNDRFICMTGLRGC